MKIYIDFYCHKKKAALLYKGEKIDLPMDKSRLDKNEKGGNRP